MLEEEVVSGYDKSKYVTERVWVTGRDGARIPVSLFHRKDWRKDGKGALFQYAYGSYGGSQDPKFAEYTVSLADREMVYAIAHVRGGQEMGRYWYDQGRRHNKINTINDFIDVTRGLVAQGYAKQGRVAALGGSGGGFLMGAVANMAPADYGVIIAMVPYVDAVTTMMDPSIPLVTREYDEWGNPQHKEDYEYLLRVSPYDNVREQAYPAMYVGSGLWDSQVQYYEPTKWVAKLRANKTDTHPLLLRMNMEAGHGGASGRFRQLDSQSEHLSFAISQLGADR
jgi:oligopeptidase B